MLRPYRQPAPPEAPPTPPAEAELDIEEFVVHVVLAVIGLVGVTVGVVCSRAPELVIGAFLASIGLRFFLTRAPQESNF